MLAKQTKVDRAIVAVGIRGQDVSKKKVDQGEGREHDGLKLEH